jgi:hypothetical protein
LGVEVYAFELRHKASNLYNCGTCILGDPMLC